MSRVQSTLLLLFSLALVTSMSAMEVFAALLVVAFLVRLAVDPTYRKSLTPPPLALPLTVFSVVLALGVLLGEAPWGEKGADLGRLRFFFVYCVLYWELADQRNRGQSWSWIFPLATVCFVVGLYGIAQHFMPLDLLRPEGKKVILYAIPEKKLGPLVVGPFNHHLTFANIFLMQAVLFLALGLSPIARRWWYSLVGVLLCVCTVWTNSRAAWIALPIALLFLGLQRGRKQAAVFLGAVAALLVGTYSVDGGFRERLNRTLFQRDELYNLDPRYRLWNAQWEIFKEHPLLGVGWNNNERFSQKYVDRLYPNVKEPFYGHAHSMPLQILSTTGLLGSAAFLWIWGTVVVLVVRGRRKFSPYSVEFWLVVGTAAAFLGFWIQGMTQWNFGDAEVLYGLLFLWAVLSALVPRAQGEYDAARPSR